MGVNRYQETEQGLAEAALRRRGYAFVPRARKTGYELRDLATYDVVATGFFLATEALAYVESMDLT